MLTREERIELISAVLTGSHILNTEGASENFHEIINLYFRYHGELAKRLPD